ncbi:MAG: hypothetical protein JWO50_712 [Candidatus Kaiserbacteria bacterium]|nr:hypothetical protein [Candidatus Kaiserbacteria bacterium]
MGGVIVALYSLFESQVRNQSIALLVEEGDFIVSKITYIVQSSSIISAPQTQGASLNVVDDAGTETNIYSTGGNLIIDGGNDPHILNADTISVQDLTFTHAKISNSDESFDVLDGEFVASATTSDGHMVSRLFYLHSILNQ